VVAATAHDLRAVVVAEMKTAIQIVWRHHVGIMAITVTLRGGEKTDAIDAPQPILRYCLTNNLRGPLRDLEYRIGYVTNAAGHGRHGTKGNESDRFMQRTGYYPANTLPACRARWDVAQGWAEGN
jgi:hypothetical protein